MNLEEQKLIQEYVMRMQARGILPTIEEINEYVYQNISSQPLLKEPEPTQDELKNTPIDEYAGLTYTQLNFLLNADFEDVDAIKLNDLTSQEYQSIPLLRQVIAYMNILDEKKELPLDSNESLSLEVVAKLYSLGIPDYMIEQGHTKLDNEDATCNVQIVRILAEVSGLTKKRKEIVSLTAKGRRLIECQNSQEILSHILKAFCTRLNWRIFDNYELESIGNIGFGFSLYMLSRFGSKPVKESFYFEKYYEALEPILDKGSVADFITIYSIRTFEQFMLHFNLIIRKEGGFGDEASIQKSILFDKLIRFDFTNANKLRDIINK